MPAKPKTPAPITHIAIPNDTWDRLASFLEVQPWKSVDRLIEELAAKRVGVTIT